MVLLYVRNVTKITTRLMGIKVMSPEIKYKWDFFGLAKSIALIALVIFVFVKWTDIKGMFNKPTTSVPQIIQIEDNAWRVSFEASQSEIARLRADLEEQNSKILQVIKDRNEKIDEIGIIKAKLEQTVKLNQSSSHVYLKGKITDHHFIKIYKKASDGNEFPIAWAMFHPNQPDPNKLWKTGTYPLEFSTNIIETEDKSGKYNRYVELNVENNQMKETKGILYPVKLTEVKWAKNPLHTKSFSFLNPRLGLSGIFTGDYFAPSLDLSISSYGKSNVDMDWRFVTLGIGIGNDDEGDSDVIFSFTPIQWNFGKPVPLIDNAFIGPTFAWGEEGTSFGLNFSIPF